MNFPKRLAILAISLLCLYNAGFSQHRVGWRASGYSGINGVTFNPSLSAFTPHHWDANLVEAGFYMDNNYAFIQDAGLLFLLRNRNDLSFYSVPDLAADFKKGPNDVLGDYFTHELDRFGYAHVDVLGPAFSMRIGENHRVGAFLRLRSMGSTTGVSSSLGFYQYDGLDFGSTVLVDEVTAAFMNWSEIGLHYSALIPSTTGNWSVGVNVRRLIPYDAFAVQTDGVLDLTKISLDSLGGNVASLTYGYTRTALESESVFVEPSGRGWGIDLGLSYATDEYMDGYGVRFGLALQDFGGVVLDKNSEEHAITINDPVALDWDDYSGIAGTTEYRQIVETFSQQSLGDPSASFLDNEFELNLPTSLTFDVDWAIQPGLYVHAAVLQPIPLGETRLSHRGYISITPRFDRKWYGLAMPVSVHAWQHFQLGLQGRIGPLVMGTDKVGSWLNNQRLHQADFYIGLKLFPFGDGSDRGPRAKMGGKIKGQTGCYDF